MLNLFFLTLKICRHYFFPCVLNKPKVDVPNKHDVVVLCGWIDLLALESIVCQIQTEMTLTRIDWIYDLADNHTQQSNLFKTQTLFLNIFMWFRRSQQATALQSLRHFRKSIVNYSNPSTFFRCLLSSFLLLFIEKYVACCVFRIDFQSWCRNIIVCSIIIIRSVFFFLFFSFFFAGSWIN